jgi:Flp pilus assembly protein TadD
MASVSEQVIAAARLAERGRTAEARSLLEELAALAPRHPAVLNALGALALAERDAKRALDVLGTAATLFPRHAGILANLAGAYRQLDRNDDALACIETAIEVDPSTVEHRLVLAELKLAAGDGEAALQALEQALVLAPDHAETHAAIGVVLAAEREADAAERAFRNAIALDPEHKTAHHNLAEILSNSGRSDEALRYAERAYLLDSTDRGYGLGYARRLFAVGRLEEAERIIKRLHAVAPKDPDLTILRAQIEIALGQQGVGLARIAELARAAPSDAATLASLSQTLRMSGRLEEALVALEGAIALSPSPSLRGRREDLLRALGRLEESWRPLEDVCLPCQPSAVFVLAESDPGEAVLLSRLRPRLQPQPVVITADELAPLMQAAGWTTAAPVAVTTGDGALIQELPRILGIDADALAWTGPYLAGPAARIVPWREALSEFPGPRVGFVWGRGNNGPGLDPLRSAFDGLALTPVSLAVGEIRHDLARWPEAIDAGRQIGGVADVLAAVEALDAIICVECLAAHVAGAIGRPGLVLVGAHRPWTLRAEHGQSVFYPSLEVFVPASQGAWTGAVDVARAFLQRIASRSASFEADHTPR